MRCDGMGSRREGGREGSNQDTTTEMKCDPAKTTAMSSFNLDAYPSPIQSNPVKSSPLVSMKSLKSTIVDQVGKVANFCRDAAMAMWAGREWRGR